jgi:hypothetical protein
MPHKWFNQRRILERTKPRALPCGKRFKPQAFSLRPRAARAPTAFGLPQRA